LVTQSHLDKEKLVFSLLMFCHPVFEFLPASSVNLCVLRRVNPICFCDTDVFLGSVHLAYNPSYSACFFSRNNIFLSQKKQPTVFFSRLIIRAERLLRNSEVRFVVQFTSVHTLFCSVHQKPSITVPSSIEK
jgi:hypothetical protein